MTVTADALDLLAGDPPAYERKPGDFKRKGEDGPPYVKSLTNTRRRQGLKADLLAQAEALGMDVPDKVTVPQLHDLLGPEPAWDLYARPSGHGERLDNPYNLIKHLERQILVGASILTQDDRHLFGGSPFDPDLDRDFIDGLAARCHEAAGSSLAADRGTHVHLLTEYDDRNLDVASLYPAGDALGIPEALQRTIVVQWRLFRERMGVCALAVEQTVVNDRWRLAGTLDRLDVADHDIGTAYGVLEAGVPFVGDIKTGSLSLGNDGQPAFWVKYPVQLAAYVDGVPYDTDTDERGEW